MRALQKLETFKNFAFEIAALSTCERAKVGCIIFDPWFERVLAIGYNGPPKGESNDSCTNEVGNCGCIHAEVNALLKCKAENQILLTTLSPCNLCAGYILNSKLKAVIFCTEYRHKEGIERLRHREIKCYHYDYVSDYDVESWR